MARKRQQRKHTGLFAVPDPSHDDDSIADDGQHVGVFGEPTHDSRLFGGPGHNSGLFDAPDKTPGNMPGLFERPDRAPGSRSGLSAKPRDGKNVGLFDKPRREDRT